MAEEFNDTNDSGDDVAVASVDSTAQFSGQLLDRDIAEDYRVEWTNLLMREKEQLKVEEALSVVIFRLGNEWLALSTTAFKEVCEMRSIHKLPHRSGQYLLGLVNVRGRLRICVALHHLLEVEEDLKAEEAEKECYQRMIVLEDKNDRWVFPVDEVYGIHHFESEMVKSAPVTVSKSAASYLKGMLKWKDKHIGLLDEDLVFHGLRRIVR